MPWTVGRVGDGNPQIIINGVLKCDHEALPALWDVINKYVDSSMCKNILVMKNQDHVCCFDLMDENDGRVSYTRHRGE